MDTFSVSHHWVSSVSTWKWLVMTDIPGLFLYNENADNLNDFNLFL